MEAIRRATLAEAQIEQLNDFITLKNRSIQNCLRRVTGFDAGPSAEDWWRWWYDENEVYASARPVSYRRVQETIRASTVQLPTFGGECLVAGTVIWTELGPRPVESLQVGDRVLCQDLDSQQLLLGTVLYPTRRPSTPTFQIEMTSESIRASGGHLFWVEGRGWTMTRDLQAGQSLRTAGTSSMPIQKVHRTAAVPLYNLVVDRHANYFVGAQKILSHDSTILSHGEASVEAVNPPR